MADPSSSLAPKKDSSSKPADNLSQAAAAWSKEHADPPPLLHHYTDAAGLLGMLHTGKVWATNARFMNDPSEIQYATRLVQGLLDEAYKNHVERVKALSEGLLDRFLAKATDLTYNMPKIGEWALNALKVFDEQGGAYIVCFCKEGDLLSQWRGYGAEGGGYAVGFLSKHLTSPAENILLRKVIYHPDRQIELLRQWVDALFDLDLQWQLEQKEFWQQAKEKASKNFLEMLAGTSILPAELKKAATGGVQRINDALKPFSQFLAECLVSFKDPSYEDEREWRLIRFGKPEDKILFRPRKGCIASYLELLPSSTSTKSSGNLPIDRVVFGPLLENNMAVRSLQSVLKAKGYADIADRVSQSKVPYRG